MKKLVISNFMFLFYSAYRFEDFTYIKVETEFAIVSIDYC